MATKACQVLEGRREVCDVVGGGWEDLGCAVAGGGWEDLGVYPCPPCWEQVAGRAEVERAKVVH